MTPLVTLSAAKGAMFDTAPFTSFRVTMLHNYAYGSSAEGP